MKAEKVRFNEEALAGEGGFTIDQCHDHIWQTEFLRDGISSSNMTQISVSTVY